MPQPEAIPASLTKPRSEALDALRGLAIMMMILSGTVPWKGLPAWMYHAQLPPPTRAFNPALPGITWVDLVFPYFLFAMGAAIPLAFGGKLDRGEPAKNLIPGLLKRGGLLLYFSLMVEHLNPIRLNGWAPSRTLLPWLAGLGAFASFFAVLMRLPSHWKPTTVQAVRALGWVSSALLAWQVPALCGHPFSIQRTDIILVLLADCAVVGTLIWLATRHSPIMRLGILALGLGIHASRTVPGSWVSSVVDLKPVSSTLGSSFVEWIIWAFHPRYLKYLFVVIPGTFAGEVMAAWLKGRAAGSDSATPARGLLSWVAIAPWIITVVCLIGLLERAYLLPAMGLSVALAASLVYAGRCLPDTADGRCLRSLVQMGVFLLVLGFVFEPYQGGIKKDHATLSYYFTTSGLAALTLAAFTAAELLGWVGVTIRLLANNGRNPMIGYVAASFLVLPVLQLTGVMTLVTQFTASPWLGAARGAGVMLVAAIAVAVLTKRGVQWRA